MASNTGAPRLQVEIGAITTDLKKGLADARAEIQRFNNELSKTGGSLTPALEKEQIALLKSQQKYQETRNEIARLALEKRKASQNTTALSGSYREAQQRLTALGQSIRMAKDGFTSTSPAIQKQIQEYNALNSKLKEFDARMGNHQRKVGNYGNALMGVIPALGQFTSAVGIAVLAYQGIQKSFATNLKMDALKYSLGQVSGSYENFVKNQEFLRNTTERLGLEIVSSTEAFKQWQGAVKFSNLTADQSRQIFESVANAGAKMKLSQDDVKGSFLALSQMVSKGKVSMEELRRQLGDRLPGAFSLAAKSMNMTEQEFDKLVSSGKLMAQDFLPNFAKELDKAFGNDSVTKVESLQASVNRLSNSFTELFQSDDATTFFQTIIDGTNEVVKSLGKINEPLSKDSFLGMMFGGGNKGIGLQIKKELDDIITGMYDRFIDSSGKAGGSIKVKKDFSRFGYNIFGENTDLGITDIIPNIKTYDTSKLTVGAIKEENEELVKNKGYWDERVKIIRASMEEMDVSLVGSKEYLKLQKELVEAERQQKLYKGATKAEINAIKKEQNEINKITSDIAKGALSQYDQKLFDINKKYSEIYNKVGKTSEVGLLAQQIEEADKLRVSLEVLYDTFKKLQNKKGVAVRVVPTAISGVINKPEDLPNLAWNKWGIDNRRRTPDLGEDFTKQFKSTLRRGIASTLDELFSGLSTLSDKTYDIERKYAELRQNATKEQIDSLNHLESLEKKVNNGLTSMLTKMGNTFTSIAGNMLSSAISTGISSGNFSDLSSMFKGSNKMVGYGSAVSLLGSVLQGSSKSSGAIIGGSTLSGLGSGAALGTTIMPGIGTAVGAVAGAVVGAISGIFSSNKASREREFQEAQLNEQKKQTALMERANALAYASSIIGQMTRDGIVTSVDRNEYGQLVSRIRGKDLELIIERDKNSR